MIAALVGLALTQVAAAELPPIGTVAAQSQPASANPACNGKLYDAFDFWLGDWTVYAKDRGALIGTSHVAKLNTGCTVRETWLPAAGKPGGNLNAPDLITGRWHQYWVDSSGQRIDLEGGLYQGAMILAGVWPRVNGTDQNAVLRITYTMLDKDSVRQLAEFSTDDGLTWETSFDHLYLRSVHAD